METARLCSTRTGCSSGVTGRAHLRPHALHVGWVHQSSSSLHLLGPGCPRSRLHSCAPCLARGLSQLWLASRVFSAWLAWLPVTWWPQEHQTSYMVSSFHPKQAFLTGLGRNSLQISHASSRNLLLEHSIRQVSHQSQTTSKGRRVTISMGRVAKNLYPASI